MGISITKLLIVLAIAVVIFGTKRLRNVGADLGDAIKAFRASLDEGEKTASANKSTIDGEVAEQHKDNA